MTAMCFGKMCDHAPALQARDIGKGKAGIVPAVDASRRNSGGGALPQRILCAEALC
jgi:hypothetical protein